MKYDSNHYYRVAYGVMIILLLPFYVFVSQTNQNNFKNPIIIIFTIIIISNEYSFALPRQAMKIYEDIIFKSFIESINTKIRILILIIFSGAEIYYFTTNNIALIIISVIISALWDLILKNQSIIIGSKNIIIGRKLISYDLVSKITYDKNNLIINVHGELFRIFNWAIGNQRYELEILKKELDDKGIK